LLITSSPRVHPPRFPANPRFLCYGAELHSAEAAHLGKERRQQLREQAQSRLQKKSNSPPPPTPERPGSPHNVTPSSGSLLAEYDPTVPGSGPGPAQAPVPVPGPGPGPIPVAAHQHANGNSRLQYEYAGGLMELRELAGTPVDAKVAAGAGIFVVHGADPMSPRAMAIKARMEEEARRAIEEEPTKRHEAEMADERKQRTEKDNSPRQRGEDSATTQRVGEQDVADSKRRTMALGSSGSAGECELAAHRGMTSSEERVAELRRRHFSGELSPEELLELQLIDSKTSTPAASVTSVARAEADLTMAHKAHQADIERQEAAGERSPNEVGTLEGKMDTSQIAALTDDVIPGAQSLRVAIDGMDRENPAIDATDSGSPPIPPPPPTSSPTPGQTGTVFVEPGTCCASGGIEGSGNARPGGDPEGKWIGDGSASELTYQQWRQMRSRYDADWTADGINWDDLDFSAAEPELFDVLSDVLSEVQGLRHNTLDSPSKNMAEEKANFDKMEAHTEKIRRRISIASPPVTPGPKRQARANGPSDTFGLKWVTAGSLKPTDGQEIVNSLLSAALSKEAEFTKAQLKAFKVCGLSQDSFIKAGSKYYKPVNGRDDVAKEIIASARAEALVLAKASMGRSQPLSPAALAAPIRSSLKPRHDTIGEPGTHSAGASQSPCHRRSSPSAGQVPVSRPAVRAEVEYEAESCSNEGIDDHSGTATTSQLSTSIAASAQGAGLTLESVSAARVIKGRRVEVSQVVVDAEAPELANSVSMDGADVEAKVARAIAAQKERDEFLLAEFAVGGGKLPLPMSISMPSLPRKMLTSELEAKWEQDRIDLLHARPARLLRQPALPTSPLLVPSILDDALGQQPPRVPHASVPSVARRFASHALATSPAHFQEQLVQASHKTLGRLDKESSATRHTTRFADWGSGLPERTSAGATLSGTARTSPRAPNGTSGGGPVHLVRYPGGKPARALREQQELRERDRISSPPRTTFRSASAHQTFEQSFIGSTRAAVKSSALLTSKSATLVDRKVHSAALSSGFEVAAKEVRPVGNGFECGSALGYLPGGLGHGAARAAASAPMRVTRPSSATLMTVVVSSTGSSE